MHRIVRIDKLIPGGSLWQRRSGYRLADQDGLARVYQPVGTPWWNPLGGWTQEHAGIGIFGDTLPFAVSCHGPEERKRFYIDVVRWSRVGPAVISYLDLYLDVLIDPDGAVSEKDEHQLSGLASAEQIGARATRDQIRARFPQHYAPDFAHVMRFVCRRADGRAERHDRMGAGLRGIDVTDGLRAFRPVAAGGIRTDPVVSVPGDAAHAPGLDHDHDLATVSALLA